MALPIADSSYGLCARGMGIETHFGDGEGVNHIGRLTRDLEDPWLESQLSNDLIILEKLRLCCGCGKCSVVVCVIGVRCVAGVVLCECECDVV